MRFKENVVMSRTKRARGCVRENYPSGWGRAKMISASEGRPIKMKKKTRRMSTSLIKMRNVFFHREIFCNFSELAEKLQHDIITLY